MRNPIQFIKDIATKTPIFFPMVALFHLFYLGHSIYTDSTEPITSIIWLQSLYALLYAIFWLGVCDMRRWAAWGYIALCSLNIALMFFLKNMHNGDLYYGSLFPTDVLFVFFILFYYKRFS